MEGTLALTRAGDIQQKREDYGRDQSEHYVRHQRTAAAGSLLSQIALSHIGQRWTFENGSFAGVRKIPREVPRVSVTLGRIALERARIIASNSGISQD